MTKREKIVLATSTVIELKPGKKYLLIFDKQSKINQQDIRAISEELKRINVFHIAVMTEDSSNIKVVES